MRSHIVQYLIVYLVGGIIMTIVDGSTINIISVWLLWLNCSSLDAWKETTNDDEIVVCVQDMTNLININPWVEIWLESVLIGSLMFRLSWQLKEINEDDVFCHCFAWVHSIHVNFQVCMWCSDNGRGFRDVKKGGGHGGERRRWSYCLTHDSNSCTPPIAARQQQMGLPDRNFACQQRCTENDKWRLGSQFKEVSRNRWLLQHVVIAAMLERQLDINQSKPKTNQISISLQVMVEQRLQMSYW